MPYDNNCNQCPYNNNVHLPTTTKNNPLSPIELENNNSETLLVFQAPGTTEWNVGKAIQPTKKKGGTAGARIAQSWIRKNKLRTDFDIINTVQCYPGALNTRDLAPNTMAICSCSKRLKSILHSQKYTKIIAFGVISQEVVSALITTLTHTPTFIKATHPTGGASKNDLDSLW